jgi:hypothetical protein
VLEQLLGQRTTAHLPAHYRPNRPVLFLPLLSLTASSDDEGFVQNYNPPLHVIVDIDKLTRDLAAVVLPSGQFLWSSRKRYGRSISFGERRPYRFHHPSRRARSQIGEEKK